MIGPNKLIYQEQSSESDDDRKGSLETGRSAQAAAIASSDRPSHIDGNPIEMYEADEQIPSQDYLLPITSQATLRGHTKTVATVIFDPKGHRLATGGLDYHVRLWDFHGMNKHMNSFRIIEPFKGNAVRGLHFNKTASHLMVIQGGKQLTMIDRDGAKILLTVKGYMYVKELHQTKGHINTIYDGNFHPINNNEFVTCSGDGSIRLWDTEQKLEGIEQELGHKTLLKCKDEKGQIIGCTGVNYLQDGKMVVGGCLDGSLQVFSTKFNLHRNELCVRKAHTPMQEYTCILPFREHYIATRNTDSTLKIWDLRNFQMPVAHYSNLMNKFPGSKMCLSPTGSLLAVTTSVCIQQDHREGYLHFYDTTSFEKVKTMTIGTESVTDVAWSPQLNQIAVGQSGGETKIFFDEGLSKMGALKCINKEPRVDKDPLFDYSHPVYLPHSLPIYKEKITNNIKKDISLVRKDPIASAKPLLPAQGPHKNGRRNDVAYTQIQYYIQAINADPEKQQDARLHLWELNKYTQQKPFYTQAYKYTQPTPIFNDNPTEEKEFEFLRTIKKICPSCGLKICTCLKKDTYDSDDDRDREEQEKEVK